MTFQNVQVDVSALPDASTVEYHGLDPRYPFVGAGITLAVVGFLVVAVAIAATLEGDLPILLSAPRPLLVLGAMLLFAIPVVSFMHCRAYGYAVREHDIVLRKNLFWRAEIIQPLIRLQHVALVRGPLDKALGLAKLKLYSAGSGRETFTIPGLPLRTAARLRRYALAATRREA